MFCAAFRVIGSGFDCGLFLQIVWFSNTPGSRWLCTWLAGGSFLWQIERSGSGATIHLGSAIFTLYLHRVHHGKPSTVAKGKKVPRRQESQKKVVISCGNNLQLAWVIQQRNLSRREAAVAGTGSRPLECMGSLFSRHCSHANASSKFASAAAAFDPARPPGCPMRQAEMPRRRCQTGLGQGSANYDCVTILRCHNYTVGFRTPSLAAPFFSFRFHHRMHITCHNDGEQLLVMVIVSEVAGTMGRILGLSTIHDD